jgi:hypothetical protein
MTYQDTYLPDGTRRDDNTSSKPQASPSTPQEPVANVQFLQGGRR